MLTGGGLLALTTLAHAQAEPAGSSEKAQLWVGPWIGLTSLHASALTPSGQDATAKPVAAGLALRIEDSWVEAFAVGLTVNLGKILNDDGSSTGSLMATLGPGLTIRYGYLHVGLDVLAFWTTIGGISTATPAGAVMSSDSLLLLGIAGRVGGTIPVTRRIDLVLELSALTAPIALGGQIGVWDGMSGTFSGGTTQEVSALGGSFTAAARIHL